MQEAFKNNQQKQKRYFDRGSRELPSLEEDGEVGLNYKRGGLNYKPGGFQRSSRRTLNHVKYIFNMKKKGKINDDDDDDDNDDDDDDDEMQLDCNGIQLGSQQYW